VQNVLLMIAVQESGGLTLGRILADIPHDGPAFVVYALIAGFVYLVWRGGRNKT